MKIDRAPTLESARLRLRAVRVDDLAASAAMWSDAEVVRYIGGKPSTRQESWSRLVRNVGLWTLLGYGYWAIEERSTGRFVGEVGFANLERTIEPSLDGIPEIGWVFVPAVWGQGFATEAVAEVMRWADANLDHPRTACIIAPGNAASIRVARKSGYRDWTTGVYLGNPILMLERDRGC